MNGEKAGNIFGIWTERKGNRLGYLEKHRDEWGEPLEKDVYLLLERVNESTKDAIDSLDDALSFVADPNKRITAMLRNSNEHQEIGND
ncbi:MULTISPECIES: hypothetical protein [Burkholderia]|uniref:hypothetical protein n=1 Tax=Burkholderia TaxID=32008 RepID=UPI00258E912D|nr:MULTISPECIES: hypothetical protein [Burkholderia]MCL4632820.1 hypothetical protein [Burkholderia sp.]MDN7454413.1 hypothetical protein [Burkholderia cenocepacia]